MTDDGGTFDVLQIDPASIGTGAPAGIFIDTGVPIPTNQQFTVSVAVNGTNLEVLIDGSSIFTGSVLGSPVDGLPFAENLTGSNYETFARTRNQPWFIVDSRPRYYAGARFRF